MYLPKTAVQLYLILSNVCQNRYAGWTDGAVKVSSLDAKTMTVIVAKSPPHGIRKGAQL